jgi:membrane protein DedA with SNARE-associated domain
MFTMIGTILCAILLWIISYIAIRNYEYDRSENLLSLKIFNLILVCVIITLSIINYLK